MLIAYAIASPKATLRKIFPKSASPQPYWQTKPNIKAINKMGVPIEIKILLKNENILSKNSVKLNKKFLD